MTTSDNNTTEKTSLYLCDLPKDIKEKDIEQFLSKYKSNIISIKTEQKKGIIAKILFKSYSSANNCRIEMNLKKFKEKSIRIMWEEKDFSIRKSPEKNLYIKGIPKTTTPREVYDHFKQYGDIFTVKISEDDAGNHYGYGYITYYNKDDAKKAIEGTNGKKIWNSDIEISYSNYNRGHENHKIYISNLPEKCTSEELKKICEEVAPVLSCNVNFDHGKLTAIVQYSNDTDVKNALDKLNNKEIKGNKINVKIYQNKYYDHNKSKNYYNNNYYYNTGYNNQIPNNHYPRNGSFQNSNLYVKNIPLTVSEEELRTIFGKYGTIKSLRLEKDDKGLSKGFGYILFDNVSSAKSALEALNGRSLSGYETWTRPLYIEFFISKSNRQIMDNQLGAMSFYSQQDNQMMFPQFQNQFPPMFIPMGMPQQYTNQYMNNQRHQHQNNYKNGYGRKNYNGYHRGGRGGRGGHYKNNNYKNNEKNATPENKNKVNMDEFNKLKTDEEKKDFLGEILFNEIQNSSIIKEQKTDMETVGKITGMIIEIPDMKEIIEIIEKPAVLKGRLEEALKLLKENK